MAHNVIHDMPYTGISIGYRWDTTPTSLVRCVAEYNHIYDVMKTLADGGGIYTLGFQPGTVLPEKCTTSARIASSIATSVMTPAPKKLILRGRAENETAAVHARRIIFRSGYFVSPAARAWRS